MKNEEILDRYLWAFNSSPSLQNFKLLGGHIPAHFKKKSETGYYPFLESLGYDKPTKAVYRVYDTNRGEKTLCFIGSISSVSFRLNTSLSSSKHAANKGGLLVNRYLLEKINIDEELQNIQRDDLFRMEEYNY